MISKSQLISLSVVPGMGPRRIRALFRKYPDLDDISCISKSDLMQVEGISSDLVGKTQNIDLDWETSCRKNGSHGSQVFDILSCGISGNVENHLWYPCWNIYFGRNPRIALHWNCRYPPANCLWKENDRHTYNCPHKSRILHRERICTGHWYIGT